MWCCPKHATPFNKALIPSVSATTWRRSHGVSTLLATLESNSSPIWKPQEDGEISGSDVLWALQRANARKKNKKKSKKEQLRDSSSVPTPTVDYTNVRPLRINAIWPAKLDDLDKRLRELSDTI